MKTLRNIVDEPIQTLKPEFTDYNKTLKDNIKDEGQIIDTRSETINTGIINDNVIEKERTWSSHRINEEVQAVQFATDLNTADISEAQQNIENIQSLIPNQASEENKLADKDFVNSTVGTNTAIFRGTFDSVEELEAYSGEKTNNDYAFVIGTDEAGNTAYNRYKYNGTSWEYEFTLNNSSFTSEQWAAIQSGITAEKVEKIPEYDVAQIDDENISTTSTFSSNKITGSYKAYNIATCSSSASVEVKEITINDYILTPGDIIGVTFTNGNTFGETTATTPSYPKLKINGGSSFPICDSRGKYAGKGFCNAGDYIELRFSGDRFIILNSDIRESVQGESGYTIYSNDFFIDYGVNNIAVSLPANGSATLNYTSCSFYLNNVFVISANVYKLLGNVLFKCGPNDMIFYRYISSSASITKGSIIIKREGYIR